MLISVVIPTLNESAWIEGCLKQFGRQPGEWELIVADGGSEDGTPEIARVMGARVVGAAVGRGSQMNAGAAVACGRALLFLHADALLPEGAHGLITEVLDRPSTMLGCFRIRHEAERWRGSWKARWLRLADLRSHFTKRPYGDQGLFFRREAFHEAGGFPAQPLMEDLDLVGRLSRGGRVVTLPQEVRVSARRFEAGWWRAFICMNTFPALYRLGMSPQRLSRWYGRPR